MAYLHAGDSELLLCRDNEFHRLTTVQNQRGSVLTNYIGGSYETEATPLAIESGFAHKHLTEWGLINLEVGDRLILATDGVTSATATHRVNKEWWQLHASTKIGAQAVADDAAKASPRLDDSTIIVVDFSSR